jgi:hypothetical protein
LLDLRGNFRFRRASRRIYPDRTRYSDFTAKDDIAIRSMISAWRLAIAM